MGCTIGFSADSLTDCLHRDQINYLTTSSKGHFHFWSVSPNLIINIWMSTGLPSVVHIDDQRRKKFLGFISFEE